MQQRTKLVLIAGAVFAAALAIVGLITAEIVHRTGGEAFCGSCHVMTPMVKTYQADIHGGNNRVGFKAECADCHLPHDNMANYMLEKTKAGLNDVFKVVFTDTDKIDWIARRDERKRYVYDSGCLSCHEGILSKTEARNPKSLEMHQHYQSQVAAGKDLQCVSCHATIGHADSLRSELNQIQPEYQFSHDLKKLAAERAKAAAAKGEKPAPAAH
ncbi:MAG: cytochrome c3 family protein [Aeromonas sp.]